MSKVGNLARAGGSNGVRDAVDSRFRGNDGEKERE